MAGVSAAYLARDGFTGAPAITIEAPELQTYWDDLGSNWQITQQYIKLYPVCRWAQPAVEAVIALVQEHNISADQISNINIETFHEATRLTSIPKNTEQGAILPAFFGSRRSGAWYNRGGRDHGKRAFRSGNFRLGQTGGNS